VHRCHQRADGGHDGGRIVFEGTPADLVDARSTLPGEHLAAYIGNRDPTTGTARP
jgi:excinuclease UvrABC ATPase subunit